MKKQCKQCERVLDIEKFHKDSKSSDGYKSICKECRSISRRIKATEERRKFDRNIKHSIYIALKYNKHGRKWEKLVGYTLEDLQKHLEAQFDDKMSWNNFGSYWWIDKIIPVRAYSFSTYGEFKKCWNLRNLRPLQKNEIMRKSDKVFMSLIDEYNLFDIMPIDLIYYEDKERNSNILMPKKKQLRELIKIYSKKGVLDDELKRRILNESVMPDKELVMRELDRSLDLFDDYEDADWNKFPIGLFYENFFGEEDEE